MSLANKMAKANYQGDPGLFGWIGRQVKGGLGMVSKLGIPGISQAAGIAGAGLGALGIGRRQQAGPPGVTQIQPQFMYGQQPLALQGRARPGVGRGGGGGLFYNPVTGMMEKPAGGFGAAISRMVPGGSTGMQTVGPAQGGQQAPWSGYHWNKSGYWLSTGEFVPPFTKMVKNRRRNPGNMKALSRSLGRVKSAKKMAKALSNVTIRETCKKA